MPGLSSEICTLEQWGRYPCFVLLRLKDATAEETAAIAAYAEDNLADIPYDLFSFTEGGTETQRAVSGTQCAHLVWLAFAHFGYDLDGDGGYVVTPADLCGSELLEVVQIYGIDPCAKEISGGG